jgi:hypothetical protein
MDRYIKENIKKGDGVASRRHFTEEVGVNMRASVVVPAASSARAMAPCIIAPVTKKLSTASADRW